MNRKVFGRTSVEPRVREKRQLQNHELDSYYEGRVLKFKEKPKPKHSDDDSDSEDSDGLPIGDDGMVEVSRPVIICRDINGLFSKVA